MSVPAEALILDGGALGLSDLERVVRQRAEVKLGSEAHLRLASSRKALDHAIAAGEVIYGVNTGFGSLANRRVEGPQLAEIQKNLLRSHAAGVGELLPEEVVRAMLLLLAASLAPGFSGVRPSVAEQVVNLLNTGITPIIPSVGSVGASGDLPPLAHAALVLIGEGEATLGGQRRAGAEALRRRSGHRLFPARRPGHRGRWNTGSRPPDRARAYQRPSHGRPAPRRRRLRDSHPLSPRNKA